MPAPELKGCWVVVTRPAQQAGRLAGLVEAAGGHAIRFPVLEIAPPDNPRPAEQIIDRLDTYRLAIFISPNAVEQGLAMVHKRRKWPAALHTAAIGPGTARALDRAGLTPDLVPEGRYDSEALLALPALQQPVDTPIAIFRGQGGRALLADTLRKRGTRVDYVECYRRAMPRSDPRILLDHWAQGQLHIITVSSGAGLRNLLEMAGDRTRGRLLRTPLAVTHPRLLRLGAELGWQAETLAATRPGDDSLVDSLKAWWQGQLSR